MRDPVEYLLGKLMAWTRRRFGYNPSRHWPPRKVSRLSYDMADQSLNGVRLEAAIPEASTFGPADDIWGDRSLFELAYYDLGLKVEFYDQEISNFTLIMEPADPRYQYHKYKPAEVSIKTPDGLSHALSGTTHENTLIRLLGEPDETGPIVEHRMHTFIRGRNWIDSYHDPESGHLAELTFEMAADPKEQGPS